MRTEPLANHQAPLSTRKLLQGIWGHLSHRRRIQLGLLIVVMLASGGAELISLGAVLPFLEVLNDQEQLWQQPLVQLLAVRIGFTKASDLLLPAILVFAAAAVLSALVRLLNLWLNSHLAAAIGSDLSCEAYRRTLFQPYSVHLQRNSSSVITSATAQIGRTVAAINALLGLITSALVVVGLLLGLLIIDASIALGAVALFGASYGVLAITVNRQLRRNGQKITQASRLQLKALQEGLGAIRDVLLGGTQLTFLQNYRKADRPLRQLAAKNIFLGAFPRFVIEAMGLVAIALLGGLLMWQRGSSVAVIPSLGALALGAQRLLPALQQVYNGWSNLTGFNAAMEDVLAMLSQSIPPNVDGVKPLTMIKGIQLDGVSFGYESENTHVLQGLNLEIQSGERIGLIGSTGSGKSTMIDVVMGLLVPTQGMVLVDGDDIHDAAHPERLAAWRSSIAHVPQSIYLADSSFAENIAFGIPRDFIDLELVKHAASQAQIASFIDAIPEGYESFVGERGVRLSGGQRQRLGIARALYKKSSILVLDEATSALDARTELAVMNSINALPESPTVIMIAHRLTTLRNCDRVVRLENGSVSADGPPQLILGIEL